MKLDTATLIKRYAPPFSETNALDSMFVEHPTPVQLGLTNLVQSQPSQGNGMDISSLRDFHDLHGHDKIDQIGIAREKLANNMEIYKKSAFNTAFTKAIINNKSKK